MGTVDRVSWHTEVQGNPETKDEVLARFWSVVDFFQKNNLTIRILANSALEIDDKFSIKDEDLTELGARLMDEVYEKWLSKVDKGMSYTDLSLFEKKLISLTSKTK